MKSNMMISITLGVLSAGNFKKFFDILNLLRL